MNVFRLESIEAPGEFGQDTVFKYYPACSTCGTRQRISKVTKFHLNVLGWSGAQLVSCTPELAVTPMLEAALRVANLQGFVFRQMQTTISADFEDLPTVHGNVPQFVWLDVSSRMVDGPPSNYALVGVCRACEQDIWQPKFPLEAVAFGLPNPSLISKASWKGEDIFRTREPGATIITERFLEVLNESGLEGIQVRPAEWVP